METLFMVANFDGLTGFVFFSRTIVKISDCILWFSQLVPHTTGFSSRQTNQITFAGGRSTLICVPHKALKTVLCMLGFNTTSLDTVYKYLSANSCNICMYIIAALYNYIKSRLSVAIRMSVVTKWVIQAVHDNIMHIHITQVL